MFFCKFITILSIVMNLAVLILCIVFINSERRDLLSTFECNNSSFFAKSELYAEKNTNSAD